MKIGDVKVGERYAALDSPGVGSRRSSSADIPREVEVLEIVEEQERVRSGNVYTRPGEAPRYRTKKRLKVVVCDGEPNPGEDVGGYRYRKLDNGYKDEVFVLESRQLIAPWADLREEVVAKRDSKQRNAELRSDTQARLDALLVALGDDAYSPHVSVSRSDGEAQVTLDGENLERVLHLAELGLVNEQAAQNV